MPQVINNLLSFKKNSLPTFIQNYPFFQFFHDLNLRWWKKEINFSDALIYLPSYPTPNSYYKFLSCHIYLHSPFFLFHFSSLRLYLHLYCFYEAIFFPHRLLCIGLLKMYILILAANINLFSF